jgi:2C-methyl-D-erythritol 2,4-cyclodiphosphate synthase
MSVEIAHSARRHQGHDGFEDADVLHAIENALYAAVPAEDPDKVLYLGPDRSARLLEIVTAVREDGSELVIHAMKMRPSYQALLGGTGG